MRLVQLLASLAAFLSNCFVGSCMNATGTGGTATPLMVAMVPKLEPQLGLGRAS